MSGATTKGHTFPVGLPTVIVVGLGPGDPSLIGVGTRALLEQVQGRFVRTWRHPSATEIGTARSFDDLYDRATSVEEVYPAIVEVLVDAARRTPAGQILYAVPGSPLVAERTVELLRADPRVVTEVIPALSFVDLAWARLGIDPFAGGVRLVDGHRFATEAAGAVGPLLVSQCDSVKVLSDIKLALDTGPEVVMLRRLGLPDEAVDALAWADIDRSFEPDHLTCLWIPRMAEPVAGEVVRFEALVRTLREACVWDRDQSHASLTPHLIEEAYEVLEALDEVTALTAAGGEEGPAYEHLEEELGDLLFQIVFHAVIAAEAGRFSLADVARSIHDKLVRRHPNIFRTDLPPGTVEGEMVSGWEQAKKLEKGRSSIMEGIPAALPALLVAAKVGGKAASVGFDWKNISGVWAKVDEELTELRRAVGSEDDSATFDELGDVLFSVANLARHLRIDPEAALRAATTKFRGRFAAMERSAGEAGEDLGGLSGPEWDLRWAAAKDRWSRS